jgi:hypothetical protein
VCSGWAEKCSVNLPPAVNPHTCAVHDGVFPVVFFAARIEQEALAGIEGLVSTVNETMCKYVWKLGWDGVVLL